MRVRLIKRITDDGLVEVEDDVPLGRIYDVTWPPQTTRLYNFEKKIAHDKELVFSQSDNVGWLPWELLERCETKLAVDEYGTMWLGEPGEKDSVVVGDADLNMDGDVLYISLSPNYQVVKVEVE